MKYSSHWSRWVLPACFGLFRLYLPLGFLPAGHTRSLVPGAVVQLWQPGGSSSAATCWSEPCLLSNWALPWCILNCLTNILCRQEAKKLNSALMFNTSIFFQAGAGILLHIHLFYLTLLYSSPSGVRAIQITGNDKFLNFQIGIAK